MNTLVLSQRFTDDSNLLWRAAIDAGWEIVRAHGFKVAPFEGTPVLYGETIFADAIAEQLGVSVVTPAHTWLPSLPPALLQRGVRLATLASALEGAFPAFINPPDDKLFAARVYPDADGLRAVTQGFDASTPVLVSSPVTFAVAMEASAMMSAQDALVERVSASLSPHPPQRASARYPIVEQAGTMC